MICARTKERELVVKRISVLSRLTVSTKLNSSIFLCDHLSRLYSPTSPAERRMRKNIDHIHVKAANKILV